ncbi:hypothetical protein ACFL0C_01850 [Patescibacteria group bacterium]
MCFLIVVLLVSACAPAVSSQPSNPVESSQEVATPEETNHQSETVVNSPQQNTASSQPVEIEPTPEQFATVEQDIANYWSGKGIVYQNVSEEEINNLLTNLDSTSISTVDVQQADISGIDPNSLIVPVISMGPEALQSLATSLQLMGENASYQSNQLWYSMFHWTNHMREVGVSPYDLGKAGHYLWTIVSGASSGNGVVLYRPGTETLKESYMFIARINGRWWTTLLAPNGAPITSYDAKATDVKYVARMMAQGFQRVDPKNLPASLRDSWQGVPPTLRFWWWSISYAFAQGAVGVGGVITSFSSWIGSSLINPIGIFFVPPCMLNENEACPWMIPGQQIQG